MMTYTIIPLFFPFIIWAGIAIVGAFTVAGIAGINWNDPKKNKLGILGTQGSGKTLFLSYLQNKLFIERSSGRDKYDEFQYELSNKRTITICSGFDIGGGDFYRDNYNEILIESDVILYFFNINKYLKNFQNPNGTYYRRGCDSRFEHVYSKTKDTKKNVVIIGTHRDLYDKTESELKSTFNTLISNKSYRELLKNIELVNLTNIQERGALANKIFKT